VQWRKQDGTRWLEADLGDTRAAFTTRLGGVSSGPFESLNLGLLTGDDPDAVRTNRHRVAAAIGVEPDRFLIGRQVHGAELQVRDEPPEPNGFAEPGSAKPAEVDGQATSAAGLVPLVFVADCLPVALSGPGGVAMVHCGWRGLRAGIVARGAEAISATKAAIGPGIGRCCYEVGQEVLDAFAPLGDGIADGRMLDLAEIASRLLDRAGVEEVEAADLCTSCEPELFFSHRRDHGRTGRQAGLIWRRDGDG
jgi:purine-nucleoside/S-methyl-5'-thioadenosine phosphorylase / adenosine deaminase